MLLYNMKRILCCTDFSENSDTVLKAAEILRKKNNGTIHLLHVSETGFNLEENLSEEMKKTYKGTFLSGLKDHLESKLQEQIKRCGIEATPIYQDGKTTDIVFKMADSGNYDLLVLGHGRSPILSQLLGSTAYKMISSTPLPLLIVKKELSLERVTGLIDESKSVDKIIIGTYNFYQNFNCQNVSFVSLWMDFPAPFGTTEGVQVKEKIQDEVKHFAPMGVNATVTVEPTKELKLADPLVKHLKNQNTSVAVMKKFSEGNLKRIYIGSTTKRLLEIFDGNLLILPP